MSDMFNVIIEHLCLKELAFATLDPDASTAGACAD
jgi:hypothetical protein